MTRTFAEIVALLLLFCGSCTIIIGVVQHRRGYADKARTWAASVAAVLWIVLSTGVMFGAGPNLITGVALLMLIPVAVMARHKASMPEH